MDLLEKLGTSDNYFSFVRKSSGDKNYWFREKYHEIFCLLGKGENLSPVRP